MKRYEDQGLVLIGIHSTMGGEKMADFVEKEEIPWAVAIDRENKTKKAYAQDSYPDYYLIDRAGKLRFADLANNELDRAVDLLLKEKPPPDLQEKEGDGKQVDDGGESDGR